MVDGVVLLVDAAEGPMPQTRFVLQKALEFGHKIIIAINKIDRPDARLNEIGERFSSCCSTLMRPTSSWTARSFTAPAVQAPLPCPRTWRQGLTPLFEQILEHIPAPQVDTEGPTDARFFY